MSEHYALSIAPDDLRRMIANLRHVASPYCRRRMAWEAVSFLFGVGRNTASAIVRRAGFDPDEILKEIG